MSSERFTCRSVQSLPKGVEPATLQTIDFHKLQSGLESEQKALFAAAITDGFFYLDLTHSSFTPLLDNVDDVFSLSQDIFSQDSGIKDVFDVDKISTMKTNGYKPKGRNIVSKDGARDGFESWVLPRNGIFQLKDDPFPHTPSIASGMGSLKQLLRGLGSAAEVIFRSLSTSLSLSPEEHLENFHDPTHPSTDILRLLKYHANPKPVNVPQTPHTDLGSLTFVFSTVAGLQVLPAGIGRDAAESDWRYVEPKAGHAIVNIGDCLTIMTNGLLKSALHRVGPLPDQPMPERYSFAYLMRPEDATILKPLNSPLITPSQNAQTPPLTSREWVTKKFKALRAGGSEKSDGDQVLTGGRGIMV